MAKLLALVSQNYQIDKLNRWHTRPFMHWKEYL